jgi:hypothetical protein
MRGEKIVNIYVIDSVEYLFHDLKKNQIDYVQSNMDREKYNEFRNMILFDKGDDFKGIIKIHFPEHIMECIDEFGVNFNLTK